MKSFVVHCLALLLGTIDLVRGTENITELRNCKTTSFSSRALIPYILKGYSKLGRPIFNSSESLKVTVALNLWGIRDFDESQNVLSLQGIFQEAWTDWAIIWDQEFPYNCVKYVILPGKNIWTPSLTIRNSPDGGRDMLFNGRHKAFVTPSGGVIFQPQGDFQVTCAVDFTYYPFDEQICHIQLESWSYKTNQVSLALDSKQPFYVSPGDWVEHPMWILVENYSYIKHDEGFDSAVFVMRLQRRPLFYYVNLIAPSLIIGAVVAIVFTVPVDEVPKIDVAVTCLIAYTVFQSFVVSDLPKASSDIPLLVLYITLQMLYIAGIAICGQTLVFALLEKGRYEEIPPPKWLRKVSSFLGMVLMIPGAKSLLLAEVGDTARLKESGIVSSKRLSAAANLARSQWKALAMIVNYVLMNVYIAAFVLTPIIMYIGLPSSKVITPYVEEEPSPSSSEDATGSGMATAAPEESCYKCGD